MTRTSEERRAAMRKYYSEHADEIRAYQHRYYEENKERVKARVRKYAHEHLEASKPRRMAYQRKYRLENPDYSRNHCRKYYVENRGQEIRRKTELNLKRRRELDRMKATLQCSRCGGSFPNCPSVIEFHHTGKDPKLDGIARLMVKGCSSKLLQAELAKCVPLCANCHRIVHDLEKQEVRS